MTRRHTGGLPRSERAWTRVSSVLMMWFWCACAPEPWTPPLLHEASYESPTLVVRPNASLPICGRTIEFLETFIERIRADLPEGAELEGPVVYQYITQAELDEPLCGVGGLRCSVEGHVYTTEALDLHEVVHAVRQRAHGDVVPGPQVLEEGVAMLYQGDSATLPGGRLSWEDLEHIELDDRIAGQGYFRAAHFVDHLTREVGAKGVARFLDAGAEIGQIEDYALVYGESLGRDWDQDWASYQEHPDCEHFAMVRRPVECSATDVVELGVSDELVLVHRGFGCDHEAVIGPIEGRVWTSTTVEVLGETSRPFALAVDVNGTETANFEFQVVACNAGCGAGVPSLRSSSTDFLDVVHLPPGRSVLRFGAAAAEITDLYVRLVPM